MKPRWEKGMIFLIVAIPAMAVLMGAITMYLALSSPETVVQREAPPLSKTSWRNDP